MSHAIGESMSSGAGSFHRSRNVVSSAPTDRTLQPKLDVMPWRMLSVLLGHLLCLSVAAMGLVVAARVAQVDAAGERDIAFRRPGVPDHHQLLVVRPAETNTLVQQDLAACPLDRLAEVLVLLLAVGELVQVRAPDQTLDDDTALGRRAEQLADGRAVVAHLLVGIATPVGEEQVVALAERLDLGHQLVEIGRTVDQRLRPTTRAPGRNRGGRVASLLRGEEPVCEFRHATRNSRRRSCPNSPSVRIAACPGLVASSALPARCCCLPVARPLRLVRRSRPLRRPMPPRRMR